ncbi:SusC/RagA family TonB-linked outer membrane protein [Chitinophaga sp. 30R24]|uniref:SusC/RagA family TonB-linked outer membrane protein n=1 Tax=Chitinophaga sp. 30R24 TaxID=3248838 RepID=UPI003B921BE4
MKNDYYPHICRKPLCLLLFMLFLFIRFTYAQDKSVTGKVTNEKNEPLPGASITVKGTTKGVISDATGNFQMAIPGGSNTLVISFMGYKAQEVALKGRSVINVSLQLNNTVMDELVVIGYGSQRKKDVTGSVGSVKGAAIKNVPATNVSEALQGRMAGVEVVKSSGAPDASANVIIRGVSSLNQPQPLYVVDGVRQTSGDNINLQDIASIDVLKDAAAAAIYGSAAAGGVIVITTKKGQGNGAAPLVNFNARFGSTQPQLIHLLDKADWLKLINITRPTLFAGINTDTLPNTDWVNELYGNATEQNYSLSVAGSTPNVNYLFSGFYNAQKGIYINNYSNIAGIRVNTDYNLGKRIKIGEQLFLTQRKTSPPIGSEAQLHNAPFRTIPIMAVYDKDGSFGKNPPGFAGPNPVGAALNANALNYKNNLQGNVFAAIQLPLHLNFRTTFGYTYNNETQDYFQNSYNYGEVKSADNSLTKYATENKTLLSNYVLTYDQAFSRHHINAVAGYEQISSNYNNLNVMGTNVGLPTYSFIQTSNTAFTVLGVNDPNGLVKSVFGRLNYNYDNRYYISGSIRRDANFTVFGPGKQAGVFPAASIGWNLSDESFFSSIKPAVNLLKLRGSYGSLGNSNIPGYLFLSTYSRIGMQNFAPNANPSISNSINFIPNPNIHWETLYETNVGVDGEALNGKLYFTVEWYNKTTRNMLYALPISTSSGITSSYYTNIGAVRNRGLDVLAGYRDKFGKVGFDVSVTAGFNKNKVLNLDGINTNAILDGYNFYSNGDAAFSMMPSQTITATKAGLPFGQFYGYKVLGLFKTDKDAQESPQKATAHAGDLIFEDYNHDGKINSDDRQVIGNPNPKVVYGINLHVNYKGFDVSALFNGVAGVDIFNGVKAYEMSPFSDGNTTSKIWGDSYLNGNGLTSQPRLGVQNTDGSFTLDPNGNYTTVSSYFVENGSYLKLKNLQVGYTFGNNLLQQIKISQLRLFVMANNLFTITKYSGLDPELGSSFTTQSFQGTTTRGVDAVSAYPHTRIYSLGLDVTF